MKKEKNLDEMKNVGIDIVKQNIADLSSELLNILLKDRTTGNNIRWATDNYEHFGEAYCANQEMKQEQIIGKHIDILQPRVMKAKKEQIKRTHDKAEVFTPSWICNEQNNLIDEAWFGRKNVFNHSEKGKWKVYKKKIEFPEGKTWEQYVDVKRLEISCGEAPYLVSRYDTVNGKPIAIEKRIGFLDRKLRVINENVQEEEEWYVWCKRAFQSVYGYEYQGDNVLLARENLLYTFVDNMVYKFAHEPLQKQLYEIARIISWNLWQMDGLTGNVPYSEKEVENEQMTIFDFLPIDGHKGRDKQPIPCKIFDWRSNCSLEFNSMIKEA